MENLLLWLKTVGSKVALKKMCPFSTHATSEEVLREVAQGLDRRKSELLLSSSSSPVCGLADSASVSS